MLGQTELCILIQHLWILFGAVKVDFLKGRHERLLSKSKAKLRRKEVHVRKWRWSCMSDSVDEFIWSP
jgi:hypothetical protein